jgi:hypothetical protein
MQVKPGKNRGRNWMSSDLMSFVALPIGIENKSTFVSATRQHHAGIGCAISVPRRDRHCIRFGYTRCRCLLVPLRPLVHRINGQIVAVKAIGLVLDASVT